MPLFGTGSQVSPSEVSQSPRLVEEANKPMVKLRIECELREAYYSSDYEMPSLVFAGIADA